jgi:hypothetical protein
LLIIPIAAAYGWQMPFFVNAVIGLVCDRLRFLVQEFSA